MGVFGEKSLQIKSYLVEATQKDLSPNSPASLKSLGHEHGQDFWKSNHTGTVTRDTGSNKCTLKIRTSSDGLVILSGGLNSVCVRVCVCMCVCLDYFQLGETWYWSSASLLYFLYPNFPQNCLRVTWVFWVLCFALQRFSFFLPMRTYLPLVPFPCISATVLSIFIKLDKNIAAIIV